MLRGRKQASKYITCGKHQISLKKEAPPALNMVNISFEWQKNEEEEHSVARDFDPVFVWATFTTRVRSYPGQDDVTER